MRFVIALLLLVISACSGGEDLDRAEKAIDRFHLQLNAGQIDQIYAGASSDWKDATPKKESDQFLSAVRDKLGAFQSGKQAGWTVNYGTNGTIVVVQYKSRFAKGDADETFTFRNTNKVSELVGYNVNSKVFVTG